MTFDKDAGRREHFLRAGLLALSLLLCLVTSGTARAQESAPHFINPPSLSTPPGFSQVVVAPDGRTVYIAGQVAVDSNGQLIGGADIGAQADRVYANLQRALASVGGSMSDLVKTTTYFTDIKSVGVLRDIRKRYLDPTHPPANAMIPLPVLSRADLLIEIEAIAILRTSFHP